MNPSCYKYCAVPQCKSTTIKTPNKLFIYVPNNKQVRRKWLEIARRQDAHIISSDSTLYFCEDHFDLPSDMINYMEYHIMGKVSQVRMRSGCRPKKFECQEDRKKRTCRDIARPYILKKQRMSTIAECLNEPEQSTSSTLSYSIKHTSTSSDSISATGLAERHNFQGQVQASDVGGLLAHDATTRVPQVSDVSSLLQLDATQSDITRLPQAEKIIASVYRYLQTEYDNLKSSMPDACDISPLANILKRTAAATGVSEQIVTDILEKGKRPANSSEDNVTMNKRAKLTHSLEDDDVSPIEEDSRYGSSTDVQKPNDDEAKEEEDYEQIETLKVECDDEEEQYEVMQKEIRYDLEFPFHETTSPVPTRLTSAQTVVKTDPLELEEQPTSFAVHNLSSSPLVEVKQEPSDVLHRQLTPAALQETSDERLQPVKTEPDDYPDT